MRRRLAVVFGETVAATWIGIAEAGNRLLDALLGPRCRYGCGQRLYPRDVAFHEHFDHAGDRAEEVSPMADRRHSCLTSAGSPTCPGCKNERELLPAAEPLPNIGDTCCGRCPGGTCYVDQVTGA